MRVARSDWWASRRVVSVIFTPMGYVLFALWTRYACPAPDSFAKM